MKSKVKAKMQGRRNHVYNPSRQLLAEDLFWAMLDRERALADRADRRFALVIFKVAPSCEQDGAPMAIISAIQPKVRLTDAVGFIDPERVGVLLVNSGGEEARGIGASICALVRTQGYHVDCEVHAYPAALHDPDQEDVIGERGGKGSAEEESLPLHMASLQQTHELFAPPVPVWKRIMDLCLAGLALILLSPLLLLLALYIKLVSPGPLFFKQPRVGRACRVFMCLKFRTMHVNADATVHARHMSHLIESSDTPMAKLEFQNDQRLIPFARVIRAAGLDELPQLINVLRGEMSLVGPRPCIPYEFEQFATWHRRRCDALPGLTGLWQVMGKNRTSFTQMMRYDIRYASGVSFGDDASILLRTLPAVIAQIRMVRSGVATPLPDREARSPETDE